MAFPFDNDFTNNLSDGPAGSLPANPNPLITTMQHILPSAVVGLGAGLINAVVAPFHQRRQQQQREDFEKSMLVAKYMADERLQGNQHQHDRAMFQENAALQLALQYLEHEQQNALQQQQHSHESTLQQNQHAHDGAMFKKQTEWQLVMHYLSTQATKEAALQNYELGQDSHEYKMARQLFPNLSLKGLADKCMEAIDLGLPTPIYAIPSNFTIPDYYGPELFQGDNPTVPHPDWPRQFARFLDQLNSQRLQVLRQYLEAYGAGNRYRSAQLLWGVWSEQCADEAAHLNLHALGRGVVPMVASEVKVKGDQLVVLVSYVGVRDSFCQQLLALPFSQLLRDLAVNEVVRWDGKRQQYLEKQRHTEAEINARGGVDEQNRQIWLEEEEDKAQKRHLDWQDYPYYCGHLGKPMGTLIGVCEVVAQLLLVDLHHLAYSLDVQRVALVTPQLPRLLPQLFEQLLASGQTHVLRQLVGTIVQTYVEALQKLELYALIPVVALDIAQELIGIEDNELTRWLVDFAVKTLAQLRQLPTAVSLDKIRPLEAVIYKTDRDWVEQLNGCLVHLEHPARIDINRAYFDRGVACLGREDFAQAIAELNEVMMGRPHAEAYWYRALAHWGLKDGAKALTDLEQVGLLQPHRAEVYELRGDIYAAQGEVEKALAFYHQAVHWGATTAQGKLDRLQLWWVQEQERKARTPWQPETLAKEAVDVDSRGTIVRSYPVTVDTYLEDLGNGVQLRMVRIPGGQFEMGSPASEVSRDSDEGPQHRVHVPTFFMGMTTVTQAVYEAVMGENPSSFKGRDRPVETVSWHDAIAFCQKLSDRTGNPYRLPSEAEWEYACRAGTTTPFHFGETITTAIANYNGNSTYGNSPKGEYRQETTPVASFPPNAFGLFDMHGNVWEWCADHWHENYNNAPSDGSAWVTGGDSDRRLLRGGSWTSIPGSAARLTVSGTTQTTGSPPRLSPSLFLPQDILALYSLAFWPFTLGPFSLFPLSREARSI